MFLSKLCQFLALLFLLIMPTCNLITPPCVKISLLLLLTVITAGAFRFNGSCQLTSDCLPRETYMRCIKNRCLCLADSEYDFRNAFCRLKINVKCDLSGKNIQPCVRGAYCDPPSFADGSKIHGASTGNCKCYRGESIEEDGTCSSASSLQRSFGHSSLVVSGCFNIVIVAESIFVTFVGLNFT